MIKSVEFILTLQQLAVVFETASQKMPTRYTHSYSVQRVCMFNCGRSNLYTYTPHTSYNITLQHRPIPQHYLLNPHYTTHYNTTTLQHYNNPPNPHYNYSMNWLTNILMYAAVVNWDVDVAKPGCRCVLCVFSCVYACFSLVFCIPMHINTAHHI
jgi:hypothetical protein